MAGLISDQLINNLRTTAYKQLITPVLVYRTTKTAGIYGTEETEALVATTTCWFKPDFKGTIGVQPGGFVGHDSGAEVRFRFSEDIRNGDRLVIDGEGGFVVQDTNTGATITLYLKAWAKRME